MKHILQNTIEIFTQIETFFHFLIWLSFIPILCDNPLAFRHHEKLKSVIYQNLVMRR